MTDVGSADAMVALAVLMFNSDETRAQADESALRAARTERQQTLRDELHALHEAADEVRAGAWVEGCAAAAGGALAAVAHAETPLGKDPTGSLAGLLDCGRTLSQLAAPLGRELGEAPSMDSRADAKQAEQEGADASTRAELAYRHYERVLDDQARTVATVQTALDSESHGNLAIIANV